VVDAAARADPGAAAPPAGQGAAGQNPSTSSGQAGRASAAVVPGLMTSAFKGGYTYSLWRGDVTTYKAVEIWHPESGDRFTQLPNFQLAGDYLVFNGTG
jgi:hypothetical protein